MPARHIVKNFNAINQLLFFTFAVIVYFIIK